MATATTTDAEMTATSDPLPIVRLSVTTEGLTDGLSVAGKSDGDRDGTSLGIIDGAKDIVGAKVGVAVGSAVGSGRMTILDAMYASDTLSPRSCICSVFFPSSSLHEVEKMSGTSSR
jgi:hypothetical protein